MSLSPAAIRAGTLAMFKNRAEEYFARQMGMTVPQWRDAQAGTLTARGANELGRDRTRRWLRAGRPAPPAPEFFR